jgi:hypothetical protein
MAMATPTQTRQGRGRALPAAVLLIALVYFVWVALLGMRIIALPALEPGIRPADWANFGILLLLILLAILILDAMVAKRRAEALPVNASAAAPAQVAPRTAEDELLVTAEEWNGRRLLEYSRPAKSAHPVAVYTKCVVPIDARYAIRVEDLIAEARD